MRPGNLSFRVDQQVSAIDAKHVREQNARGSPIVLNGSFSQPSRPFIDDLIYGWQVV